VVLSGSGWSRAPTADEPSVRSGPDKFLNTNLDKILKDKGIQTVIATGTNKTKLTKIDLIKF
jgi:hypothetical protein